MATVSSTTTEAQLRAAYLDNCGYREDDSASEASALITVLEAMLDRGIRVIEEGEHRYEFSTGALENSIKRAQQFLANKNTVANGGSGVKYVRFESDFRG